MHYYTVYSMLCFDTQLHEPGPGATPQNFYFPAHYISSAVKFCRSYIHCKYKVIVSIMRQLSKQTCLLVITISFHHYSNHAHRCKYFIYTLHKLCNPCIHTAVWFLSTVYNMLFPIYIMFFVSVAGIHRGNVKSPFEKKAWSPTLLCPVPKAYTFGKQSKHSPIQTTSAPLFPLASPQYPS